MKKLIVISIMMIVLLAAIVSATGDKLKITEIEASFDSEDDSISLSNPKTDIKPDNTLTIKVTVENQFTTSEDVDIEDIEVSATLENIEDGNDIEFTSSKFDLSPNDDKTVKFEFEIPLVLDDDQYDLNIEVVGEDTNDTKHKESLTVELNVDKENHELMFYKNEFSPQTLVCDRDTNFLVGVINIGENEEEVTFTLKNDRLGYSYEDKFKLDERPSSDENQYDKELKLSFPDAIQGTYTFEAKVSYNGKTEKKEIPLVIQMCEQNVVTDEQTSESGESDTENSDETSSDTADENVLSDKSENNNNEESSSTNDNTNVAPVTYTEANDYSSAIIIALEIIVIIVGIALIVMLNKRK